MPHEHSYPVLPKDIVHNIFLLADFCIDTRLALQISPKQVKPAARCVYKTISKRRRHVRLDNCSRFHKVVLFHAKKSGWRTFTLEGFVMHLPGFPWRPHVYKLGHTSSQVADHLSDFTGDNQYGFTGEDLLTTTLMAFSR